MNTVFEVSSRSNFRYRLFGMFLILSAIALGLSAYLNVQKLHEQYNDSIKSQAITLWRGLSVPVCPLVQAQTRGVLATIARRLIDADTRNNRLQSVAFLSTDMAVLAQASVASATPESLLNDSTPLGPAVSFIRPIALTDQSEPNGFVRLVVSVKELDPMKQNVLVNHLLIWVGMALLSWFTAQWLSVGVQNSLRSLEEAVNMLSAGKLDTRLPGSDSNDLAPLITSFNRMAASIDAHLKELDHKNQILERRVFELSTLQQAGRVINAVLNLDRLCEVIVDTTIQVLGGVKRCSLMLADRNTAEFVIKSPKGIDLETLPANRRVPLGEGVAGKVFSSGEPILLNDLAEGEKTLVLDSARISRSSICVPIKSNDEVIGVLSAGNKMSGEPFTANDLALLETLASQAGVAMKNARIYFDLDRKLMELGTLHEVGKSLSMVLDIETLLNLILDMTTRTLGGVKASSLILLDEDTGQLQVKVHKGIHRNLVNKTITSGEGIAGKVFAQGLPMLISSPPIGQELTDQVTNTAIRSSIFVPLRIKYKVIGVLTVADKFSGDPFDQNDLEILVTLASQITIAIHNARLYEDLEASYLAAVRALANSLDAKDTYTAGHSERVALYSTAIGRRMNLPQDDVRTLQIGSLLHDIGKIGISEAIIQKPSRLTEPEYELIKTHPVRGASIIEPA